MTGSYPIRVAEPRNVKQFHKVPHLKEITRGMKPEGKGFIPRDHSGSAAPLWG